MAPSSSPECMYDGYPIVAWLKWIDRWALNGSLETRGYIFTSEEKVMRGQSHLHVIMSVMSCDSHECSHWWNRVAWHGCCSIRCLSGWHRCQSLRGTPHLNLSTRLKWAETAVVYPPPGSYVDWESSDEIFQMCVNSICAFLTHHPSIFDARLCAALACFLGRLFELFIEWSLSKLWISYRFTVVQPHMHRPHPPQRMEHVGLRSSRVA